MRRDNRVRIVLDEDLSFLRRLNGVGAVFNRVFREIFREIRKSGLDGLEVWDGLVEGRIGIRVSLETGDGVSGDGTGLVRGVGNVGKEVKGGGRSPTVLDGLVERVRDFELEGGGERA